MATFDPFTEQILGLREQQALAQKLRDQGLEAPQGQTVSGWYVPPNKTQYLAQALKSYLGGQDVQAAKQGIQDLVSQRQKETQDYLAAMPKATTSVMEDRSQLPEKFQNQVGPSPFSRTVTKEPTVDEIVNYAMKAPGATPAEIAGYAFKGAEAKATREANIEKARIDALAKLERDKQHMEMLAAIKSGQGEKLKPIPLSANTAILGNDQSLKQLNDTIALIEQNPDAVGFKGYLPNAVLNRVSPEGTDARAGIADIGSLKLHERSGAAVTASESPRLMPFIPLATDDAPTVLKKLNRLRDIVASEQQGLSEIYSPAQGYRANPISGRNIVPTSPASSDGFSIRPKQP